MGVAWGLWHENDMRDVMVSAPKAACVGVGVCAESSMCGVMVSAPKAACVV